MDQLARTPRQIGAILRRQRGLMKLSQTELAERAGLRQELISGVESGKPGTRIETICDLFAALDLDLLVAPRSRSSAKDIEDIS